jgi:hypothetical protein
MEVLLSQIRDVVLVKVVLELMRWGNYISTLDGVLVRLAFIVR